MLHGCARTTLVMMRDSKRFCWCSCGLSCINIRMTTPFFKAERSKIGGRLSSHHFFVIFALSVQILCSKEAVPSILQREALITLVASVTPRRGHSRQNHGSHSTSRKHIQSTSTVHLQPFDLHATECSASITVNSYTYTSIRDQSSPIRASWLPPLQQRRKSNTNS